MLAADTQQVASNEESAAEAIEIASGVFAGLLTALSLLAYRTRRTRQLLFVSAAFGMFSIRALIGNLDLLNSEIQSTTIDLGLAVSVFGILTLFFIAIVTKNPVRRQQV